VRRARIEPLCSVLAGFVFAQDRPTFPSLDTFQWLGGGAVEHCAIRTEMRPVTRTIPAALLGGVPAKLASEAGALGGMQLKFAVEIADGGASAMVA
jgi:hypothetical protein